MIEGKARTAVDLVIGSDGIVRINVDGVCVARIKMEKDSQFFLRDFRAEENIERRLGMNVTLNGGAFINKDGTWRVVCCISGMPGKMEAMCVSQWLSQLVNANVTKIADDVLH